MLFGLINVEFSTMDFIRELSPIAQTERDKEIERAAKLILTGQYDDAQRIFVNNNCTEAEALAAVKRL